MNFEEKLIKLRKSGGLSQEDLAEKLGVSRQAVSRWESGSTMPDIANLIQLSELFGVSTDYLVHDSYESDADIPLVKEKNEEIKIIKIKKRNLHLFSALCFLFSVFCSIIGIVTSSDNSQLIISVFICSLSAGNSVLQFILYFKK